MMAPPPLSPQVSSCESYRGHALFSLENLYKAYRECRRRKRNTYNALVFEANLEENLWNLHVELNSGRYTPGRFLAFLVKKPKRREIFAADFRDRVVHHLLVSHLEPYWERKFIHDSYACRKGKGTYRGVERLRSFCRKVTSNGKHQAWCLQLDVRGFFVTLDRRILYERLIMHELDPVVQGLIEVILLNDPTENCRLRGALRGDFESLPSHKTLFKAQAGCGLPIGNLTSQFFSNIYLDVLDQFIKHQLKANYYIRYCDDLVLLSQNKEQLQRWEEEIGEFLAHRLRLELNERRKLFPVSNGVDFLGYIVRPNYLLVRRRVVGTLRQRLEEAEQVLRRKGMKIHDNGRAVYPWSWPFLEKVRQWLNSYLGHLGKASTHGLTVSLWERFPWLNEYFLRNGSKVVYRYPTPRHASLLIQQKRWFSNRLPGHALMIRQGGFWEMLPATAGSYGENRTINLEISAGWPKRFPQRNLKRYESMLWEKRVAVAWIQETGRRLTGIAERALAVRWTRGELR